MTLLPQHADLLRKSAISQEVADERGYWSATTKSELEELGFGRKAQRVPSLVIPVYGVTGELEWSAHRPDKPRHTDGRERKYEIPYRARHVLDVPQRVRRHLRDPEIPLVVTEGSRKVDAAVSRGLCCISVFGTYAFRGTDAETQGKVALGDWEHVALKDREDRGREVFICFDSDVMRKPEVQDAMDRLSAFLHRRGAHVRYVLLPEGGGGAKVGLDDFFAAGHSTAELWSHATADRPRWLRPKDRQSPPREPVTPRTLEQTEATFRSYMHLPDPEPLHVLLGAIAGNLLPGEPVWLLLVGAAGGGKSEFVRACNELPEVASVTKMTEPALLSGTSAKEAAADATGGVLRQIGSLGVLSFKDFTSVLSADRDALLTMLGALREVFDGYWTREVGTDGGRQLVWQGKAGLIGGVTPTIDRHHQVIAEMGERLLFYRLAPSSDSDIDRVLDRAIEHCDELEEMRKNLADAVAGVFEHSKGRRPQRLSETERQQLRNVVKLVAAGRASVLRERGELMGAGEPEVPARLIQQLERLLAGMDVIGLDRPAAWKATLTTAISCIPEDRRRALAVLHKQGEQSTTQVADALRRPTNSVRRSLEDLNVHRLAHLHNAGRGKAHRWTIDKTVAAVIEALPDGVFRSVTATSTSGTPPPLGIDGKVTADGRADPPYKSPGGSAGSTSTSPATLLEDS